MISKSVAPVSQSAGLSLPVTSSTSNNEGVRLCIIATYFGQLPAYFQLWLRSCARNPHILFLVITDQSHDAYCLPENVRFERMTLQEVRQIFSAVLGTPVALNKPYKICDFRPIFWIFVDWFRINCSHWGHCDIDVIFGNLKKMIPEELLQDCDRLFEVGHLSIYRYCALVNSMAFSRRTGTDLLRVVSSDKHFGFDEHRGVNLAWQSNGLRWHRDQRICFDVEPHVEAIQTSQFAINRRRQVIYWSDGDLFHAFRTAFGRLQIREIAYVHFQKRQIRPQLDQHRAAAFAITPDAFVEPPLAPDGAIDVPKLLALAKIPSLRGTATVALNAVRQIKAQIGLRRRATALLYNE